MPITGQTIRQVAARLFEKSLKKIPEDTKAALRKALAEESNPTGRETLKMMLESAEAAEATSWLICSDSGIPVYFVKVGTKACIVDDLKEAIKQGYEEATRSIKPPILPHVTHPFTLERGYTGQGMPVLDMDIIHDTDYVELTCCPKGLGSGRWADLKIFSFPSLANIEKYIIDCVINAGSQPCPPVVIGVGIGGTFDCAAKMAAEALIQPLGGETTDPFLDGMEKRLLAAINQTGIGPMGTGGDISALSLKINYAASHGCVPVAVCFNCWPNRRLSARIHNDGPVTYYE